MDNERRKILKMVEDGMLSSDEAEEILDALDKAQHSSNANSLTEKVNWEQGQHNYSGSEEPTKGKAAKIFGFIEEAFTKIKNVDLDLNFGEFISVSHVFQHNDIDVSKVDIDIANGSVKLSPWDEADVRIECEAKVYQVNNQDVARKKLLESTEFDFSDNMLQFTIPSKQIKVDVTFYVPNRLYNKVNLHLFNGSIHVEDVNVRQLRGKTTNGSITVGGFKGKSISLETVNGKVKADRVEADDFEAETISGSILVDGSIKKVDAQVVNGSIHGTWEGDKPEVAFLKTTTGSIRLHVPTNISIDGKVETNIGSIHCDLPDYNVFESKKDRLRRLLKFEANNQSNSVFHLEAETKTGSIWIIPN